MRRMFKIMLADDYISITDVSVLHYSYVEGRAYTLDYDLLSRLVLL
jgi:hypothetical protein